jgi:Zn-dependent protease
MKFEIKIFDFKGVPVNFKLWFLLLFAWMPATTVICLFFAVLVHEMAHAYAALRLGYHVRSIGIDLFYGSADVDMTNCHERDSMQIVAAGPLSNLMLLGISMIFIGLFPGTAILNAFALVNFVLFVFNILPIYPMDGGRLLKDFLMLKMRSRLAAKKTAGWVSLVTSAALLAFAISGSNIILGIFCLLFIYFALKELEYIK